MSTALPKERASTQTNKASTNPLENQHMDIRTAQKAHELFQLSLDQEQRIGEAAFKDFRSPNDYAFYSITLNSTCRDYDFLSINERERALTGHFKNLVYRLNRLLDNSNKHPEYKLQHLHAIEHFSKRDHSKLVQPHIHATLAVPRLRIERFTSALVRVSSSSSTHRYTLLESLLETPRASLSAHIEELSQLTDIYKWLGYSLKQHLLHQPARVVA